MSEDYGQSIAERFVLRHNRGVQFKLALANRKVSISKGVDPEKQTAFIGTVTDKQFVFALAEADLSLQDKQRIHNRIKQCPLSLFEEIERMIGYQDKRFYMDECLYLHSAQLQKIAETKQRSE